MDVSLIYLLISTPETEMYMVVIPAKGPIYMFHTEGLALDETAWKNMEQMYATQFPKIIKYQFIIVFKERLRNFLLDRSNIH